MNEFWRKLCDLARSDNYVTTFGDPTRQVVAVDNYTYSVDDDTQNITNAAGGVDFELVMDSDSDFVLTYMSVWGRLNGASELMQNPAILVQITDESSGRNFFNQATLAPLIAGQGGFPFLLTSPRVIRPRSTLRVNARSAENVIFSGFYFSLHGSRIYYA